MGMMGLLIGVLYNHFFKMKERGRNVVPWVNTSFVLSLEITILIVFLVKLLMDIINRGYYQIRISEPVFIGIFILLLILFFFLIKGLYFNTGKHLIFYEQFLAKPEDKRRMQSILIFIAFILIPVSLYLIIGFDSLKYQK